MNYQHVKFVGISRPIPDVATFATPIFMDEENNYLIQNSIGGKMVGFIKTFVDEEFIEIGIDIIVSIGSPELHAFECSKDNLILGTSNSLIPFLAPLYTIKTNKSMPTAKAIQIFIEQHKNDAKSVIDFSSCAYHIYLVDSVQKWNIEIIEINSLSNTYNMQFNNPPRNQSSTITRNRDADFVNDFQSIEGKCIKVLGVGGGGCNAITPMITHKVEGIEYAGIDTDASELNDTKFLIGNALARGLGAGANPEIGRQAAIEDRERIADILRGAYIVFIVAGMGGGTGTGGVSVVAEVARELGILSVAVVTKPFPFEGRKRMQIAEAGINELGAHVDCLITIPNEKLMSRSGKQTSLLDAFNGANNILLTSIRGIADLIIRPGIISVDFKDIHSVMSEMGSIAVGTGCASGENRGQDAAEAAIRSPLLEDVNLREARGILVSITGGLHVSLNEYSTICSIIEELISNDATVVVGTILDPEMNDDLRVTLIATGLDMMSQMTDRAPRATGKPTLTEVVIKNTQRQKGYGFAHILLHTSSQAIATDPLVNKDLEYLDIPAFLRKHSDE